MATAVDYQPWCIDEDVMVQLRPGIGFRAVAMGASGAIELATMPVPDENGHAKLGPDGKKLQQMIPPLPLMIGRMKLGSDGLLDFRYRVSDSVTAIVSLHPDDIQHVVRLEQSLLVTR